MVMMRRAVRTKEVAVASKSCLKRTGCVDSSKNVVKGNVKWKDLLGEGSHTSQRIRAKKVKKFSLAEPSSSAAPAEAPKGGESKP